MKPSTTCSLFHLNNGPKLHLPTFTSKPRICAALLAFLCAACPAFGQAPAALPRQEATPNDTLKSPEVQTDNRVAFRIYAPKASEVTLGGDWVAQNLGQGGKLEKGTNGVWTITVGPLPADLYSYSFTVDGVRVIDPKNAMVKPGINSVESMFFLPGKEAAFEDNQPVPHGSLRMEWYQSATLETQRRLHVYVPPGYENAQERLPVLYLLHGGGDDDAGWSTIGRAGFILDNLQAEKRAKPMIIVMPNGSLPRAANQPAFTPGSTPSPEAAAALAAAQERFSKELFHDVIPFIEKRYRVLTDPANRAVAGLSMGGGQTLRAFASHPDQFGYVAIWSAGAGGRGGSNFEERYAAFLKEADQVNRVVKLLSISVGEKDFALAGSKALAELLAKHEIKHEFQLSAGGHTWINWRQYLNALAPRLFR